MQDTVVEFKSLDGVIAFVSPAGVGSIDTSSRPPRLKGKFRLRLRAVGNEYVSAPIDFGPGGVAAGARAVGMGWELAEIGRLTVRLESEVRLRYSPRSPLLRFTSLTLRQDPDRMAPAIVRLDDVSISLAPDREPSGTLQLMSPRKGGWEEVDLTLLPHPDSPNDSAIFIRPFPGHGVAVVAGAPGAGLKIDHAPELYVQLGSNCVLAFSLTDVGSVPVGALSYVPTAANGLRLAVDANTGLMLQREPPGLGKFSRRPMSSLLAHDGMFSAGTFADDQLLLRRATTSSLALATAGGNTTNRETTLFGAASDFTFHLEIPEHGSFDPAQHRAEFRYESGAGARAGTRVSLDNGWGRFYGLRVAGLFSNRSRQEIFDVSLALVRLMPGTGGGAPQFHFEAGGDLDGEVSIVSPKPDPSLGGQRTAAIATTSLALHIGADSSGHPLGAAPVVADTCLVLRTADETLELVKPTLHGPPMGHAATAGGGSGMRLAAAASKEGYSDWVMRLPQDIDQKITIALNDSKTSPPPRWIEPFVTVSRQFELLEQPGAGIKLIGKGSSDALPAHIPEGTKAELTLDKPDSAKKTLVYSAVVMAAALYPWRNEIREKIEEYRKKGEDFLDTMKAQVNFSFASLTSDELTKYVKSRAVDALQFGFSADTSDPAKNAKIIQFIDDNTPKAADGNPPVGVLHMPFDVGLSVILFDYFGWPEPRPNPLTKRYTHEIMFARNPASKPGMLFKLGKAHAADQSLLGWKDRDYWADFAREQPSLWPRKRATRPAEDGARLDPSAEGWTGIMMRDLPVAFPVPPEVAAAIKEKSALAGKFYELLNTSLQLRYGWLDPTGATWYVTMANPAGYDFTPDGWSDFLTFRLERIGITGAGGKPAGAEGELSLTLNKIKGNQDKPLRVAGRFGLDVSKSNPVTFIELSITNNEILESSAIPGFEKVVVTGLTTDFVTATVRLELTPSAGLAAALPVFKAGAPTPASLVLNFGSNSQSQVQLSIQTDEETNLFGRYPLTIQGIFIQFGVKDAAGGNRVLIRGRLGLGLPGLEAVGADVILRQKGQDWTFDIYINEIDVALSLGDNFRLNGILSWAPDDVQIDELRKPGGFNEPLNGPKLPTEGDTRNFWAVLALKTGSFIGDLDLLMKIGSHGERTFWVGAARSTAKIRLGSASLESPAIVFAHNADIKDKGGLRAFLTNPHADLVGGVRPPDGDENDASKDLAIKRKWLQGWVPSTDIGAVIAGSGYLHLSDTVAESPKADDAGSDKPKFLTALVATDSGLFRLDAQTKFMKTAIIGFAVAIDTKNKRLMAAIRAPEIATPNKENPKYVISPGTMSIELSYDPDKVYFGIGIGWPPLLPNSDVERDWSQSVKVYVADLVPINTFWGGFKAELDGPNKRVIFGYAIRAGWTWKAELNGADIAKASAELGITLGGVLEFLIELNSSSAIGFASPAALPPPHPLLAATWNEYRPLAVMSLATLATHYDEHAEALWQTLEILDEATSLSVSDLKLRATVYGDIWGKGSVEFLGVTLASVEVALRLRIQICGGLKHGITWAYGHGEIEVSVEILCVKYKGKAGFDLWLVRGECGHFDNRPLMAALPMTSLLDLPQGDGRVLNEVEAIQ